MLNTHNNASVHVHAGRVAFLVGDSKETLYITKELLLAARQINNGYHYPSTGINREA